MTNNRKQIDRVITQLCLLRDPVFSVSAHEDGRNAGYVVVKAARKDEDEKDEKTVLEGAVSPKWVLSWKRELATGEERALSARIVDAVKNATARREIPRPNGKRFDRRLLVPCLFAIGAIVMFVVAARMDEPRVAAWNGSSSARPEIRTSGGKLVVKFDLASPPPGEVTVIAGGGKGVMQEVQWVGSPGENEGNRERSFALLGEMETLDNAVVRWTDGEGMEGGAVLTTRELPKVSLLYWLSAFFVFGAAFFGSRGIAALTGRRRR